MVGPSACPISQESSAGSEELRGTADVWVYYLSGHPKMGHTGEVKFLEWMKCFLYSDFGNTCWLQQGYEFTLLSRLSFIFMTNAIMLLTFLTFLQIISFPFFLCFISFV